MTLYIHRVSMIIPAAQKAKGDTMMEQLGKGPSCFSVEMTTTSQSPQTTHYGLSMVETQAFLDTLDAIEAGTFDQEDFDLSAAQQVLSVARVSVGPAASTVPLDQYTTLAGEMGVKRKEREII